MRYGEKLYYSIANKIPGTTIDSNPYTGLILLILMLLGPILIIWYRFIGHTACENPNKPNKDNYDYSRTL